MVNLTRLIREVEEHDGDYLIVYQATGGKYNSNPCVRIRFLYNSSPRIRIRIGDELKMVERKSNPLEVLRVDENDPRYLENLKDISYLIIEELLKKRRYQNLGDLIKGEFEDNKTYVVFVESDNLTDKTMRKAKRLLSSFRRRMDGFCMIEPKIFLT